MNTLLKKVVIFMILLLPPISGYCFFDDPLEVDLKDYLLNDTPQIFERFNTINGELRDAMTYSSEDKNDENIASTKFPLELMYRVLKNNTIPALEMLIAESSDIKVETMEMRDTHDLLNKMLMSRKDFFSDLSSIIGNNSDSPADYSLVVGIMAWGDIAKLSSNDDKSEQYKLDYEKKLFFLMDKYKMPHEDHIFKKIELEDHKVD